MSQKLVDLIKILDTDIGMKNETNSKKSIKGERTKLVDGEAGYETVLESDPRPDMMVQVYNNGQIINESTDEEIKERVNSVNKSPIDEQPAPDMTKVAGGWLTDQTVPLIGCLQRPTTTEVLPNVYRVDGFMHERSCDLWVEMVKGAPVQPEGVSIQGMMNPVPENIGSRRITMFNRPLAKELERLFNHVDFRKERVMTDFDSTDFWQGDKSRRNWRYEGVSPMLRTLCYKEGGRHAAHYDQGFIYKNDSYRTLCSFVLYLTTNSSGATRIIDDGQANIPVWDRNHADWDVDATEEQILLRSLPKAGSLLIFDHRICHDVKCFEPEQDEERVVVRGDLIFQSVLVD